MTVILKALVVVVATRRRRFLRCVRYAVIGWLQTEAELARQNPGKMVSSDNSLSIPSLPQNPSRVDRLVVESGREHARVSQSSVLNIL